MRIKNGLLTYLFCLLLSGGISAQVNCDFSFTQPTGCVPLAVNYCDLSTSTAGPIVSWDWELGGVSSNVECPSRVYGQSGTYTICLTVTDSEGNTGSTCKDNLIEIFALPVANFEGIPTAGCSPLEVTYYDLSSSADGTITDWLWDFGGSCGTIVGDGSSPAATCTYTLPDAYNITLTITDDNNCVGYETKLDYINVSALPEILVTANDTFDCTGANFNVNFTNSSDVSNLSFEWDFGNGQSFSGPFPPPISYDQSGSYTVTVIGTDNNSGCEDTLVFEDYINVGYPADFSYTPDQGCEDLTVTFTDESVFVADSVFWDFGDGATSTAANPTHTYTEPGCYTVLLTRWVNGCVSNLYASDCIFAMEEPDVWYTNDNLIGCDLPHVVNFSGGSSVAQSWLWDFGDGTTSTEQNPTHFYDAFGVYPVTLTVTSSNGCSKDTLINTIEVAELEANLVNLEFEGCAPLEVTLEDNTSSITAVTSWEWEVVAGNSIYTSTDQMPTFSIADTGVYTVTLIVSNTLGCTDTASFEGAIQVGIPPEVNFEADPTETCIEIPIQFTDLTPGDVDEWFWDFGNGDFSSEMNPEYFYSDTGYYDISLIVMNNGCVNTISFDDYIHIMSPVASFDVINYCESPNLRTFFNSAIDADSVFWDFGVPLSSTDTSSVNSPDFIFPGPGTYTVTQTVFNSETGCDHSTTSDVQITSPQAMFSVNPMTGCAPLSVTMIDESIDAVAWQWSSTNGVVSNPTAQNPTITFSDPGAHTENITLVITDVNECMDTILFVDTILVNDLEADFIADLTFGCAPLTVQFTDLSVNNWFADIVAWSWDVPGVGISSAQNPVFTFSDIGTYTINLIVTDSWGCTAAMTKLNYIDVTLPDAAFNVDSLSCTGNEMLFENTSTGTGLSYAWDFGDGTISDLESPTHAYNLEGTYVVCLDIIDVYGCEDSYCFDELVVADPLANFTLDSTFASCPPLPVNFTNTSINASTYLWDFGDGSGLSTLDNPTHVYTIPGIYEVTLIATSTDDCIDTLLITDLIVLEGPEGEYSVSIDTACAPAEITFTASSIDYYTYIWDFGTGVLDSSNTQILNQQVTFVYDEPGLYIPTLSFLNNSGCFRTLPVIDSIYVAGLDVDFVATDTSLCGDDPQGVSFIITIDGNNTTSPITSVEWIFENGSPATSTSFEPNVTYSTPGFHDVTFIAHSEFCSDTIVKEGYIKVGAVPDALFDMSQDAGCDPLLINFIDQSTVVTGNIVAWNWDFNDGTVSPDQNPAHVFNSGIDIPVTLEVTSDAGCTNESIDFITVYPLVEIDAGEDEEVCIGEITQLQASITGDTTGMNFYWTPANSLSCSSCLDPWASPDDTTTYTFVVFSPEGCQSTSEVTVFVKPYEAPVIEISPDTTLCANQITQIQVSAGNDVNIFSYQWDTSTSGLSCYSNCFNPVASPLENSTYVVTVTSVYGCSSIDSITIDVIDQYQPFAGEDVTICEGDNITLDASFGSDPYWLVSTGLSCAYCPNPVANPDSTTTYVVQITTDIGCEVIDTITVNVIDFDDVSAGEDVAICLGEFAVLSGEGEGEITWSPSTTLSDEEILNPEALPDVTTVYTMTAINGDCTISDSVTVQVNEETEINVNDFIACEGEEIVLSVDGAADTYEWSPADLFDDPTSSNPFITLDETTAFSVTASLGTCTPDTEEFVVEVNPAPEFYLDKMRYYLPGQTITLNANLLEAANVSYQWIPSTGLSCDDCSSPSLSPTANVSYTLIITNEDTGCSYEQTVNIVELTSCSDKLVGVPNAFSPNNDGINDELELIVSPTIDEVKSFHIFNRWGGLVYHTDNKYGSWDGNLKGQPVDVGVYVYVLKFVCILDGTTVTKSGDITIVR